MSRLNLRLACFLWFVFWLSLIGFILCANVVFAAEPTPTAPQIVAPPTCAFYSNTITVIEPLKDSWERPLGPAGTKEAFYGCLISVWEVDELGNQLGGSTVIGLVPSAPGGGGTKVVPIPPQFMGKMIKANGFCANGYGFGPNSDFAYYFVKGK